MNLANSANVQYNGEWIKIDDTWEYEPGESAYIDIPPSTTYAELLDKLYDELEVDRSICDLVIKVMYKSTTKRNIPCLIKRDKDVKLFVEENCTSKKDHLGYIPLCISIVEKASANPSVVQKNFEPDILRQHEPKNKKKRSVEADPEILPDLSSDRARDHDVVHYYPDPDFNDFDKIRREDSFAVGQIWALYDPLDGMPRVYARISRIVSTSAFKVRVTWLEASPDSEDEIKWVNAELPISCGKLGKGDTQTTDNLFMFSHQMQWEKGSKRDTFKVYPRKGETWALFRNWNMNWHSTPESKREFEYEFVEIMSHYNEDNGVTIAYLGKVKGFSCLFRRTSKGGVNIINISPSQLLRFSHRVPSFRLTGKEADNVPKNSFELDPASLPSKLEEINIPKVRKVEVETVITSEEDSDSDMELDSDCDMESDSEENSNSSKERPEIYEKPEPEFFDFDGERSEDKFQIGQFWAIYSDEDRLPKYYGFVKKVDRQPNFKISINWITPCSLRNTMRYVDKKMPITCGVYKYATCREATSYNNTTPFSHRLKVEPTSQKKEFGIYPKKGEVWAVYKNWNLKMSCSDLKKCEYDLVEILEETDFAIRVVVLERMKRFHTLFKACRNEGSLVEILRPELLKFSHRIPAFRMTNERGGCLKGCLELDPAALPLKISKQLFGRVLVCDSDVELDSEENSNSSKERPEVYETPEPEFFDFDGERSKDKFRSGQFWAIYSDEDGLPKYYAFVNKVDRQPNFKISIYWFTLCASRKTIRYADKKMPITCGVYKYSTHSEASSYTNTNLFSHRLKVEPTSEGNEFRIYPKKGEVWAVYKNWNLKMSCSDLKKCEYDVVEILEKTEFGIRVVVLERMKKFNSVFKACSNEGSVVVLRSELLKFSHQIPAFRLTNERGGSLKGCLELDPAALPLKVFQSG